MHKKTPLNFLVFIVLLSLATEPSILHAKPKTYAKRGMWIGALSGGVVAGGTLAATTAGTKCESDSDFQICGSKGAILTGVGGAVGGALLGMGIGALIGSRFEKKEPVVLAPHLIMRENKVYGGVFATKRF